MSPLRKEHPLVDKIWSSSRPSGGDRSRGERVLPTGGMHLVIRLNPAPLGIQDAAGEETFRGPLVGGVRAESYLRHSAGDRGSVGVMLRPGACATLFGVDADTLADRHVLLSDLWGGQAESLQARLEETANDETRRAILMAALHRRLGDPIELHPVVAFTLEALDRGMPIGEIVRHSGYSQRYLITRFRRVVGHAPKTYQRLRRFNRVLAAVGRGTPWSRIALECGYSDQAHLSREFKTISGVTPGAYRRAAPRLSHHLPL